MAINSVTSAPPRQASLSHSSFPPRHGSPLNPNSRPRALKTTAAPAATDTKTHLANLDRVLLKHPPPPPPPPPKTHELAGERESCSPDTSLASGAGGGCSGGGSGGLPNPLNLPFLFPIRKLSAAGEQMSPRSLIHLQRLLSESPRPSPKSSIAHKWRLLHGSDHWSGLLDPLDPDLRRELLRYGDFVSAAYGAFHSAPSNVSPSRHRGLLLPDRTYRATATLFATSALEIPKWAHSTAPPWLTQRTSSIGYVAVCDSDREIRRMGRRDIVIALRGTATCLEWAENLRAALVPLNSGDPAAAADGNAGLDTSGDPRQVPKVAKGFQSLCKTAGEQVPSLSTAVVAEVRRLMELYKGEELSITIAGHSLGAALAFIIADELRTCIPRAPPVAVVSFGGPRVGNRAFADRVEGNGVKALRIVNAHDVITRVPGAPLPHVMEGYQHVGSELRVDTRDSPYLRPDADPSCSHDLEAYLHLVDGFMGTGYPFRSTAHRSITQLLQQQRPNVKEVYVNRAEALGVNPAASLVRSNSGQRSPAIAK